MATNQPTATIECTQRTTTPSGSLFGLGPPTPLAAPAAARVSRLVQALEARARA
jgi:hypothetical protein